MDLSGVNEKLHEAGQKVSEEAKNLKAKLIAKLSEENAQSPQQRLKNAMASHDGAKAAERSAKAALQEARDAAEKFKRYAASAESRGDMGDIRKFEDALSDLLEKLPSLESAYTMAAAKTQALGEIVQELTDALNAPAHEIPAAEVPLESEIEALPLSETVTESIPEGEAAFEGAEGGL